jgi:hypothetical protein
LARGFRRSFRATLRVALLEGGAAPRLSIRAVRWIEVQGRHPSSSKLLPVERIRLQLPPRGTVRYEITRHVIGEPRFVEITKDEYELLRSASERLPVILALEEKLDMVLANYAEYEGELLRLAVEQMVWPGGEWPAFRAALYAVNRRILNFLSSSRQYIDQTRHELSELYGKNSAPVTAIKARASAEYDSSLAYRVIEMMRNYVQHRGMPVGKLSFPVRREHDPERVRFMVMPHLDLSQLRQDPKIKARVLDDLEASGKTNLSEIIRSYLESIGRIHEEMRRITDPDVQRWEQLFSEASVRARAVVGDDLTGLAVVVRESDGTVSQSAYLLDNVPTGRRALREKNSVLVNFAQRYVTNTVFESTT